MLFKIESTAQTRSSDCANANTVIFTVVLMTKYWVLSLVLQSTVLPSYLSGVHIFFLLNQCTNNCRCMQDFMYVSFAFVIFCCIKGLFQQFWTVLNWLWYRASNQQWILGEKRHERGWGGTSKLLGLHNL